MGDGFRVDPAHLRTQAPKFGHSGEELGRAHEQLRRSLEALGTPWGDDEPGTKFGPGYQHLTQQVMGSLATLTEGLGGIEVALAAMADNVELTDEAATIQ